MRKWDERKSPFNCLVSFNLDDLKFVKAPRSLKYPFHRPILQAEQQSNQLEEEGKLP